MAAPSAHIASSKLSGTPKWGKATEPALRQAVVRAGTLSVRSAAVCTTLRLLLRSSSAGQGLYLRTQRASVCRTHPCERGFNAQGLQLLGTRLVQVLPYAALANARSSHELIEHDQMLLHIE